MKINSLIEIQKKAAYFEESEIFRKRIAVKETLNSNIIYKIADTREELENAYKLAHDIYVEMGFMDTSPFGLRLSEFNALPSTTTFVAKTDDKVVMTLTLFKDSFIGLPLDIRYKNEIQFLRDEGRNIGELGAFASQMHNQNAIFHLYKMLINYAINYLILDDFVVTVHPRHSMFYKYVFGFTQIGELKTYSSVKNKPALLFRLDLHRLQGFCRYFYPREPIEKDLHYFIFKKKVNSIRLPRAKIPVNVWNTELIQYFFLHRTDVFKKMDRDTAKYFEVIYDNLKI